MARDPFLKLFPGDFLQKTGHLSQAQVGAYMLLIFAYWNAKGPLPDNADTLRTITRTAPGHWPAMRHAMTKGLHNPLGFFEVRDGLWHHDRLDSDLAARRALARPGPRKKQEGQGSKPQESATLKGGSQPPKPDLLDGIRAYNEAAEKLGLAACAKVTDSRLSHLAARYADLGGPQKWADFLSSLADMPHLLGHNDRGWKADFDWITKQSNFLKIIEGRYVKRSNDPRPQLRSAMLEAVMAGHMAPELPLADPGDG